MKWNQTLIPTLRDVPQDAEIPSHRLMLRAGLIRKLTGGLYTFLPLGLRALRNVERIVREEMDRAGGIELLMPALQHRELWDRSGRYDIMDQVMFRIKDRQNREMVLGPTHEEVITDLVSREIQSYRQLPKTFYQIQTKFRDEIRPRFGLMRAKEFIMKDAYSFDLDWDSADTSYQAMYNAYQKIFDRCGLETKIVEADTGAMGGKWSHEFMVLADAGEDGIAECNSCSYAANMERAERAIPTTDDGSHETQAGTIEEIHTPNCRTIEEVASFFQCSNNKLIKTLIYLANNKPIAVLIPGDRELNEHKLMRLLETVALELADDATIQEVTNAPVGFAGPMGLNIPIYADISLAGHTDAITGANKNETHLKHVDLERDATIKSYEDICIVKPGDHCPKCDNGIISEKRGIEVGHVFKLGTKYSKSFNAKYLDDQGAENLMVMGCYGIGVTRTLQSIIEQSHDDNGIIWPLSVAPYKVAILTLDPQSPECMRISEELVEALEQYNIDVIHDDRDERPGVKFKDADLLGFPVRVVIGNKSLAKNNVEIKLRTWDKPELTAVESAAKRIKELVTI